MNNKSINNFILILLSCLLAACAQQSTELSPPVLNVAGGTVVRLPNFPSIHISPRTVDIWLPDSYDSEIPCNVLYMHDGQMLYDSTTTWNKQEWGIDEVLGELIANKKIPPCIVVGVWNGDESRHSDYFPEKPFDSLPEAYKDSLLKAKRYGGEALFSTDVQSDAYLKFLVEELIPYVDKNYSTWRDPSHNYIAGSSMGGLISMYALCEYPEVFGGAACLSTHWLGAFDTTTNVIPQSFMTYLDQHLPQPATHKLYFDFGTETLDKYYEPFQQQADSIMRAKGYSAVLWKTVKFVGHDHSERSWQKRLDVPLTFLMGE